MANYKILDGQFKVVPVIELPPESVLGEMLHAKNRDGLRQAYFEKLGLPDVKLAWPGSSFVPTDQITSASQLPGMISGGYVLYCDDMVILSPMWCSDLRNIEALEAELHYRGHEWESVWLGHPNPYIRYEEPYLILSNYRERNDDPFIEEYAFKPEAVLEALPAAKAEIARFAPLEQEAWEREKLLREFNNNRS